MEKKVEYVLAIAGDRHYSDYHMFAKVVKDELERYPATKLLTGDATGTDTMAACYAEQHNIPYTVYCASKLNYMRLQREGVSCVLASDWGEHGRIAGPMRNFKMLQSCGRVLLFDGGGPGSKSVKSIAAQLGKGVELWEIHKHPGTTIAESGIGTKIPVLLP